MTSTGGTRPRPAGRRRRVAAAAALAIGVLLALGACGATAPDGPPGDRIPGRTLTIYTSLSLQGTTAAGARAVLAGERLALAQHGNRIGRYTIALRVLDDDTPFSVGWDPGQTSANGRTAAADPTTIGYLGDFGSGASAIAIPLLNRVGIPQISPTSAAVGLTSGGPGASPGEPAKYYPAGRRTFVQLAPNDAVQAAAQVALQQRLGCRSTYVLYDGEVDGSDAAAAFNAVASARHLPVVGVTTFDPRAADYASLAATVAGTLPDCVLVSALPRAATSRLTTEVAAALPHALMFATASLAQPTFTAATQGGLSHRFDARITITAPVAASDRAAAALAAADGRRAGVGQPYLPYGYEAMRMMLTAIATATDGGRHTARRSRVLSAVFAARPQNTVLGSYAVRRDGTTTLTRYGAYRVIDGRMVLWTPVDASSAH